MKYLLKEVNGIAKLEIISSICIKKHEYDVVSAYDDVEVISMLQYCLDNNLTYNRSNRYEYKEDLEKLISEISYDKESKKNFVKNLNWYMKYTPNKYSHFYCPKNCCYLDMWTLPFRKFKHFIFQLCNECEVYEITKKEKEYKTIKKSLILNYQGAQI